MPTSALCTSHGTPRPVKFSYDLGNASNIAQTRYCISNTDHVCTILFTTQLRCDYTKTLSIIFT